VLNTAAKAESNHEFAFSDREFEQVRRMIYEHAGIALAPGKSDMVYSRLVRRLRVRGLGGFREYLALLEAGDDAEWQEFVNALTTNLTSFFREEHHFPELAEHIRKVCGRGPATIWCTAASTGEEPYSLAITMMELYDSLRPPVKILATDIDTGVLRKAELGVYTEDRVEKLSPERLRRFFLKGSGSQAGKVRVRPELRNLISFRQLNLLDRSWPVRGPLDAIFCRNVMIYFDKPTQLTILERFAPLLRPEGLLFAGHSESFHNAAHIFQTRGKTIYELAQSRGKV
jgi:chemotaxis protein methyltransferase CheR